MSKKEILEGSASIEEYFKYINDRHKIFVLRNMGKSWPWTDDPILRDWKFTNVFRQLDKGTIALNSMLGKWFLSKSDLRTMSVEDAVSILYNIVWYRMFNLYAHAYEIGWQNPKDFESLLSELKQIRDDGRRVFTPAHMTTGRYHGYFEDMRGEGCKVYGHMLAPIEIAEGAGEQLIARMYKYKSFRVTYTDLLNLPLIGPFIAYEIVCDLRFTPLLKDATDKDKWANLGPGAVRGLEWLGMPIRNDSMVDLYNMAPNFLGSHVRSHFNSDYTSANCPPFELREIEHCLCEFDKYMRVKNGIGTPRERYRPNV